MSHQRSSSCFGVCGARNYAFLYKNDSECYHEPVTFLYHYFQCCCAFLQWMNCYDRRVRRTRPAREDSRNDLVIPPRRSRVNGWSLPIHSFQLVAWLFYTYLAIVGFGIYIPLLPYNWKYAGYCIIGIAFASHFVMHIVAVSIDPADHSVRAKNNYRNPMPALDRAKHPHAIQNLHCYLCEVDVGLKAKHCSSCNKCISDFDHHCRWLNNCVGGRNYWFFFCTVLSAVLGIILMVLVILYVFIEHFVNPTQLRTAPQFHDIQENSTWLAFLPVSPVETSSAGILVPAFISILMGLTSLLLLGHLLGFHIYLLTKKLSTYEYIVKQRHTTSIKNQDKDLESTSSTFRSQNVPAMQTSVGCDSPLSASSSAFKYQDRTHVTIKQSNGDCAGGEIKQATSDTRENSYYTPKQTTQSLAVNLEGECLVDSKGSCKSAPKQKPNNSFQESVESIEQIPVAQNPLESCAKQSTPSKQSKHAATQLATTLSPYASENSGNLRQSFLSTPLSMDTTHSEQELSHIGTSHFMDGSQRSSQKVFFHTTDVNSLCLGNSVLETDIESEPS
ncbi:putative palmitoyltransferase ZDHHC11B isoform X1 [Acipenser oxyrinchus oxyrinchus]|uniref:Palmitoyltransferase n=1 Tax=Acipenser oxyrinchus oxyrinchus TaxID=40147 RepID=A0AAD8GFN3_ACIOX|nr:putative palmitoyltransferase ZDHHC11B isoform X1 [Acipenser oxyrinchus oxyrinchus]